MLTRRQRESLAAIVDTFAASVDLHRGALSVPLALRAHGLVDLGFPQLVHHAQAAADAEREQTLTRGANELAHRLLNLRWQRHLRRLDARDDLAGRYLLHGGSSCPLGLGLRPERSQPERTRQEDRRSKFYEISDNLLIALIYLCCGRDRDRPSRQVISHANPRRPKKGSPDVSVGCFTFRGV